MIREKWPKLLRFLYIDRITYANSSMNSSLFRSVCCGLLCFFCALPGLIAQGNADSLRQALPAAEVLPPLPVDQVTIRPPAVIIAGLSQSYEIELPEAYKDQKLLTIEVDGNPKAIELDNGKGSFSMEVPSGQKEIGIFISGAPKSVKVSPLPGWLSILPPLLAIVLALVFREVIISLFLGIFLGAGILSVHLTGSFLGGLGGGFLSVIDHYILDSLNDRDHLSVIVFSLLIGGIVAVITRNGGMQGIVQRLSKIATSAKSGQFATWLLGIAIFFDDYANSLVVGNTMRSITDKLRISREKLSYIVDSTAAPVSAIAFITTWIGAELSYIKDGIATLEGFPEMSAYSVFLGSLSYSFYPILAMLFIVMVIYSGRDYGPMLKAERRARETGQVKAIIPGQEAATLEKPEHLKIAPGAKPRAFNAVIPIAILVLGVLVGLLYTGGAFSAEGWKNAGEGFFRKMSTIIGNSDSYTSLLWASLTAMVVALALSVGQKAMGLFDAMKTMVEGFKTMFDALLILTLAWALALVTEEMHTADFLVDVLGETLSPYVVPSITFLLAAFVAFSTGSSWSTMAILYPLALPLAWKIGMVSGIDPETQLNLFLNVVSTILAGSVMGDHCSPISDTTILSSLASDCNHIDHVRTQLPYALTVGVVGMLGGTFLASVGVPSWLCFVLCLGILGLVLRFVGKPSGESPVLTE